MKHYNPQQKQRNRAVLILVLLLGVVAFVMFSDRFERIEPRITINQDLYWNPSSKLSITIEDNIKIASYKVALKIDNKEILLASKYEVNEKIVDLDLTYAQTKSLPEGEAILQIEARDISLWKFGNSSSKTAKIIIDKKPPVVTVVGQSYAILNGGSAAVVFEAKDPNLKSVRIETKNGRTFEPSRFYKDGFYASLIARDSTDSDFVAYVVATDKAGNITKRKIPYFYKTKEYRYSKIELTNSFLDGKITELFFMHNKTDNNSSRIDKFLFVNEDLRNASNDLITIYSKNSTDELKEFDIKPFYPLPNSAVVGYFGDKRDFTNSQKPISRSYHLGLDQASVREAKIFTSNGGKVVFADDNGIYGNMVMIDHGFGLNSIYGHCTDLFVSAGDIVEAKSVVASTGATGLALGDHLHFELRIGAVPVNPTEWMDSKWIKTHITKVLDDAKMVIDGRED